MVGSSDPLSFECSCGVGKVGDGLILLFYRYFAAPPQLPKSRVVDVDELHDFQRSLCERLHLKGKIRIASEGFNVTLGGTKHEIDEYVRECVRHWSFEDLDLDTQAKRDGFFKPTSGGCACAFETLNVRITSEITPMGVTNYAPKDWNIVKSLSPAEFHQMCWDRNDKTLLDVRNHYESRIGYFVDPMTGNKAIMPEVRRFSQFPQYVKAHMAELEELRGAGNILTYCTGGIRCEKSVRWMAERLPARPNRSGTVYTLQGGIAAYLTWMDEEIKAGRKTSDESLFRGKNYVFDSRGSMGLANGAESKPVSACQMCGIASDRLSKCRSRHCHLVIVVCNACEDAHDPRCCDHCKQLDTSLADEGRRSMCSCEQRREARLRLPISTKLSSR